MISSIDPINGHDVIGVLDHPSIVDGILTIYFESDATRTAYLDTPINHPYSRLPGYPADEDDRGGSDSHIAESKFAEASMRFINNLLGDISYEHHEYLLR